MPENFPPMMSPLSKNHDLDSISQLVYEKI
jgi:hypothetical protein